LLAVAETVVARVDLGYFYNFKSAGTLLIEADDEGLQHLGASLRSLEQGSVGSLAIEALPFVTAHHGVRLTAARGFRESVTRCGTASNEFRWQRTELGWQDAAERIEALIAYPDGHQYFEGPQIVVQVSKGEYGADWWGRHG